ncbi:MAG: four helix bundle protein [Planctomycetota bacterium]|nr:four helix bundle protein [Planctomycetota bacterium]
MRVRSKIVPEDFDFENLTVYQKALDYIDFVYQISEKFPDSERFGFTNNFRRAAQSIALNIGEGSGGTKSVFHNLHSRSMSYRCHAELVSASVL